MNKTLLTFKLLTDLGRYVKVAKPDAYVIETSKVTLLAYLTKVQIAIAIEEYQAALPPFTFVV